VRLRTNRKASPAHAVLTVPARFPLDGEPSGIIFTVVPLRVDIESLRGKRGLTRAELAARVKVTTTTIFNLERNPDYNPTLALLRSVAAALGASVELSLKEGNLDDKATINIGNDELILHLRKANPDCNLGNEAIGKRTWVYIRDHLRGEKIEEDQPTLWAEAPSVLGSTRLPKTATQFRVLLRLLPELFAFVEQLGREQTGDEDDEDDENPT
jgi:DNA-binding XRE family transcriptional regulator